jgi:hypothetical protein
MKYDHLFYFIYFLHMEFNYRLLVLWICCWEGKSSRHFEYTVGSCSSCVCFSQIWLFADTKICCTVQYTPSRSSFITLTVHLYFVFLLCHFIVFIIFSTLLCNLTKKVLKNHIQVLARANKYPVPVLLRPHNYSRFFGYSQGSKEPNPHKYQGLTVTNSMQQKPSWEVNSHSDITCHLWNLNTWCRKPWVQDQPDSLQSFLHAFPIKQTRSFVKVKCIPCLYLGVQVTCWTVCPSVIHLIGGLHLFLVGRDQYGQNAHQDSQAKTVNITTFIFQDSTLFCR